MTKVLPAFYSFRTSLGTSSVIAAVNMSCSNIVSNSFFANSKLFVHAGILKTSLCVSRHWIQVPELRIGLDGTRSFSPHPVLQLALKWSSISSGSFTFPKSNVLLIRALMSSRLHQFSTLPSRLLIKLTCTTEYRYAATSGSGKAYNTAGP